MIQLATGEGDFPAAMMPDIERFLAETHPTLTPGQDVYPQVFETAFYPLQRMRELERMMRTVREIQPKTVMEIGADKAGSLYHWCQSLPSVCRVIACEVRGTPYARLFERAFPRIQFLWLPQSSYAPETVHTVREWLNGTPIDALFIDGDKSYFDLDFSLYLPMMNPAGIVLMHDVCDEPMTTAFQTCSEGRRCEIIADRFESLEAAGRESLGIPSTSEYENWLRIWHGRSCTVGVIRLGDNRLDGGTRGDNNKHTGGPHMGGA